MTDLPSGDWTPLLIRDQWPNIDSLEALSSDSNSRHRLASSFEQYGDVLLATTTQNLGTQEGATADNVRISFGRGIANVRRIAEVSRTKGEAYASAHRSVSEFRSTLRELAADGNNRIDEVNRSKATLSEKVAKILNIVIEVRARAATQAARCLGDINVEMGSVLTIQGIEKSALRFASDNGIEASGGAPRSPDSLESQVAKQLQQLNIHDSELSDNSFSPQAPLLTDERVTTTQTMASGAIAPAYSSTLTPAITSTRPTVSTLESGIPHPAATSSQSVPTYPSTMTGGEPVPTTAATLATGSSSVGATRAMNTGAAPSPAIASAPALAPTPVGSTPSLSGHVSAAPSTLTSGPAVTNPLGLQAELRLSPEHFAETFNAGQQIGSPVSAAAEAISQAAANPVHTPHTASIAPLEASTPATPLVETAHAAAPAPSVIQMPSSPTEVAHPVLTPAPAIAPTIQAPPISPAVQAAPPSSLLAYGADVRPSAVTAPAAPALPPPALPGSAPVNSASAGQPALVRQQPTVSTPHAPAAGLTERAVAATATGAAAGIAAENAAAQSRLQRLLDAVARQRPRLRWAIGDLEDGSTVLVTDLADGWIPPGVAIPTGVRLLNPAVRRGDLTALLGPAVHIAAYQPGQHLPPADAAPPPAMSVRARDTTAVDDLGWELSQATKWRDGLPRLAHTLAKAVSSGTGVLESEAELLRDHMTVVARAVIAGYPAAVDRAQVGNWQLLATIDALISNEKRLANYHFAWFQAHALTREGRR